MPANLESMFYVRETPWHGLGVKVEEALSSEDALRLSGLDWKVTQRPIYTADFICASGNVYTNAEQIIPNYKANVRDIDGVVLGVVTDRYKIVQNEEAFAFTDALIKNDASNATLPISDKVVSRLERWREQQQEYKALQPNDYVDTGYICTKPNGELLLPNYVSQHFTLLLKRNNMPHIRFHDLRHSSASFLRSLGFDMKVIQTWLRHKDIQTTMNIYTHLDMEAKENVADILNSKLNLFEA